MPETPQDVLALAQDRGARMVDLRFCDLPGLMQHFSIPVEELTEDGMESGYGFDGSSIRGFQAIHESDMLLLPDPATAVMDPFREVPTLQIHCFVADPITLESYSRDPRYVAQKAESHLRATDIADVSYWGPELEFYIFDGARFDQNQHEGYYHIESVEGVWASGQPGSRGYRPRYKEGYFPVPPMDQHQDLRSEMALTLIELGIPIEVQHHEVGTAGQAEMEPAVAIAARAVGRRAHPAGGGPAEPAAAAAPLRRAGLQRGLDAEAARLQQVLRGDYLHHPALVEEAFGRQALALLRQLDTACANAEDLAAAATERFAAHPDAAIITSMPGLAELTGARVLAEIGDDRTRFADARGLKAYAGSAPVTRASGKSTAVLHRRVKNQRLASVGYVWAFAALTVSPGARAHYDRRKAAGDRHVAAQRNLFNRLLGCLHHCLHTGQTYDKATAFPTTSSTSDARAA